MNKPEVNLNKCEAPIKLKQNQLLQNFLCLCKCQTNSGEAWNLSLLSD